MCRPVIAWTFALFLFANASGSLFAEQRLRVAVLPFVDRSGEQKEQIGSASGNQAGTEITSKGDLGGQIADAVITELVKLGRYDIVERTQMDKILDEQKVQDDEELLNDLSRLSEAARILGADLVVLGSITEAGSSKTGRGTLFVRKKDLTGRVVLDSRLIDVKTTKAIWGTTTEGTEGLQSKRIMGFGKDDVMGSQFLLGKAARQAANALVEQLVPVLDSNTDKIGRGRSELETAAALRGAVIYLAAGAALGVQEGDSFRLFVPGEPFKVGEKTIREQVSVGTMVVTDVHSEYATGDAPEGIESLSEEKLAELKARRKAGPSK